MSRFAYEFRKRITDLFKSTPVSNDPIGNTQPSVDYSSQLKTYDAMGVPGNVDTYTPNDMQIPLPPVHTQEGLSEPELQAEVPPEYEPVDQALFDEMMDMAFEDAMPDDPDPYLDEIVQHPMDEMDPIDEFEKDLEMLINPFGGM